MTENTNSIELKKEWVEPVLVEYGDVNALTQTKTFLKTNGGGDDVFQIASDV